MSDYNCVQWNPLTHISGEGEGVPRAITLLSEGLGGEEK
jgi:hypothetical protein